MAAPQPQQSDSTQAAQDLTGTTVGRFAIRARLGVGGMGEVYRADDSKLKRPVALKRMAAHLRADEHYRRRFLKEAERASSLNNQHIAAVYDVLEESGEIFLVMEFVEGTTLRHRLPGPVHIQEFLEVAVQCAEALAAAQEKGVVHCDIKPENIMLTPKGHVKVLDFGVAKRLPRPDQSTVTGSADTKTTGFSGTPAYMAPEVLLEKESVERADIFSLGVVFYEMLSGKHPFLAGGFMATSDRILHEEPAPLGELNPKVPTELVRIVTKMLVKDPTERYATARDLRVDLRALQRAAPFPGPPRPRGRPRVLPSWWGRVTALALVLLVLASAVFLARRPLLHWIGLSPIPEKKNLVVLPFQAIGGGVEDQVYAAGLTEALNAKLTQLTTKHNLQVVPAGELRARRVTSAYEARKELGVNLVLTGTVQRTGTTVRVTFALADASTFEQLRWEEAVTAVSDPFGVQDQVVAGVIRMLELELQPREHQALTRHGTQVPGAHGFYLEGRGYVQNYDKPENVENAINLFGRALALDSNYAMAHAGLGEAYLKKYETTKETHWMEFARRACERAVTLDAKLSVAHICLGTLHKGTGEYERATAEFQRALEMEPTSDDAYRGLASAYERLGKMPEAEKTYRQAIELRPHYWAGYSWLGAFYHSRARYAEAAMMFGKVVELVPDSFRGLSNLGAINVFQGRYAESIPVLQRSVAIRPSGPAYNNLATAFFFERRFAEAAQTYEAALKLNERDYVMWGNLGDAHYWTPGRRSQAASAYQMAISLAREQLTVNPRNATLVGHLARYHARLGDKEQSLGYLQRALALAPENSDLWFQAALVHQQFGEVSQTLACLEKALAAGYSPARVRDSPNFDSLRGDQRFQELLSKLPSPK